MLLFFRTHTCRCLTTLLSLCLLASCATQSIKPAEESKPEIPEPFIPYEHEDPPFVSTEQPSPTNSSNAMPVPDASFAGQSDSETNSAPTPSPSAAPLTINPPSNEADLAQAIRAFESHDGRTAFDKFLPFAQNGNAIAQEYIGRLFYRGKDNIPRDCSLAQQWFTLSAAQNHPPAQNAIGLLFSTGCGHPYDLSQAAHWFTLSAQNGFAPAQFNLAELYLRGNGVQKDEQTALYWYRLAAAQGYDLAIAQKRRLEQRLASPRQF